MSKKPKAQERNLEPPDILFGEWHRQIDSILGVDTLEAEKGWMTADELVPMLNLSRTTVFKYMKLLVSAGNVEKAIGKRRMSGGRPCAVMKFRLVDKSARKKK